MPTVDYIKQSLAFVHRALADARNGTPEQLHFVPQGGSHSIAWCLWHTSRIEDIIVNSRIRKTPEVWNAQWAQRIGLPFEGTGNGQADEEARAVQIKDMDAFAEYQEAVWRETAAFLDAASDADLQQVVPARNGTELAGEAISLHILGHFNGHRGEMNLLRGMQGLPTLLVHEGTH